MKGKSAGQAVLSLEMGSDGVASLVFDQAEARVNVLSSGVMKRLDELLGQIEASARSGQVRAVVVRSGKDGSFIAGADINEIAEVPSGTAAEMAAREGQRIFRRLDLLPVPTVAAVDGLCLGGGTELILACDARIGSDRPETKIGLPEVRLGFIPGFGGTTRLPRVIGLREALGLILTGATVSARRAQRIGLISERMHPAVLYERAHALAVELAQGKRPRRPGRSLLARLMDETPFGRALVLRQAKVQVLRESGGHYPAPLAALDVIRRSARLPLDAALEVEASAVGRLVGSDVSRNLIHVFRLTEAAKKAGPAGVAPRDVERVAVVGAGVMGGGIAQLLAYRDIEVRLKDINANALGLGLKHAREMFDRLVERGRLEKRDVERYMDAIAPTLDYTGFGTADLVIEAVVERMEVKQAVLREVETHANPDCVLSTNTSSLSVSEMQRELARPENFAGMHFFNPVHRMPLVEVVRGERTSDQTVATVVALTRRLEKTPVIVRDGPGFLVNRVLAPYLNEAGWLLAEGGAIEPIDTALREFGMPMGPLRLLDEIGLDVARHAGGVLAAAFGERLKPPPPITALAQTDLVGRKGGRGFYQYARGREEGVNTEIYRALGNSVAPRRTISAETIRERCLLAMVNEAARVLEDRIVGTPGDVDLGMITGTGFPPFRGGLLRWADSLGVRHLLVRLLALESAHGARFTPAPLIRERAAAGTGFYDTPTAA